MTPTPDPRRRARSPSIRLWLLLWLCAAAQADGARGQDAPAEITRIGGWTVFYADAVAPLCGISAQYRSGAVLTVKRSVRDPAFFVQIFNREWTSIENGQDYDLVAKFTGRRGGVYATQTATGVNEDGLLGLSFPVGPDFVKDFRRQRGVDFYLKNGRKLGAYSLDNTARAMTALAECVEALIEPAARDPFQGLGKGGPPSPDPGRPGAPAAGAAVDI